MEDVMNVIDKKIKEDEKKGGALMSFAEALQQYYDVI